MTIGQQFCIAQRVADAMRGQRILEVACDLAGYHWWYRPGVGAGAIPTNGGRHCVFAAMPPGRLWNGPWRDDRRAAFDAVLHQVDPALAGSLPGMPDERLHVFAGRRGYMRRAFGPGWALVGDAITARLVVGADGIGSTVARLVEPETVLEARHATALIFGYFQHIALRPHACPAGPWSRRTRLRCDGSGCRWQRSLLA